MRFKPQIIVHRGRCNPNFTSQCWDSADRQMNYVRDYTNVLTDSDIKMEAKKLSCRLQATIWGGLAAQAALPVHQRHASKMLL